MTKRSQSGSKLLGGFLRQLRGSRSLQAIEDLSKTPPLEGRIRAVDVSTLSKIETGKQYPSLQTLLSLEALYEVSIQRFLDHVKLEKFVDYKPQTADYQTARDAASAHLKLGDYQKAYASFLHCEDLAPTPDHAAQARLNKGTMLWKMGMLQEAANEYCDLLADLNLSVARQVITLNNLAAVHRAKGNLFEARLHAQEGLKMAEAEGMSDQQAFLRMRLGNILDDLHEGSAIPDERTLREALRHHEKALELFKACDLAAEAALTGVNMGSIYCRLGNFIVGLKYLREGLSDCEAHGNRWNIAYAMKELAHAHYKTRNIRKAKDYFFDCERLAERNGYVDLLFICYFYLREMEVSGGGLGTHEYKRLKRLRPLQEGTFWELEQFDKQAEAQQESVG